MRNSTYYDLKLVEGTDIVNPLTTEVPNLIKIDEAMHENAIAGVTLATELTNGTVHALLRENTDCAVIRFIATSEWKAGDSVTVDGLPVTALLPSGETLPDGAYVINANVLCILTGTNLTVFAERKKVDNANELRYGETPLDEVIDDIIGDVNELTKNKVVLKALPNTLGEASYAKPWLELQAQFNNTFVSGTVVMGTLSAGGQYQYIGHIVSGNYAMFIVHGYTAQVYHVYKIVNRWYCQTFTSEAIEF